MVGPNGCDADIFELGNYVAFAVGEVGDLGLVRFGVLSTIPNLWFDLHPCLTTCEFANFRLFKQFDIFE